MLADPSVKYKPYTPFVLKDRQWPSRTFTVAPTWLSTDLRDGNQALATPMTVAQKTAIFRQIVKCGFKEIEVAYPSASNTDFAFVRGLIDHKQVPDDVWIQVLTPAREDLIRKTLDSVAGAKHVIFHMYNATSPTFRDVVFRKSKAETIEMAVNHTKIVRQLTDEYRSKYGTRFRYEYSPEAFSQTEPTFILEICEAVKTAWGKADHNDRIIFNLPATVEIGPPNHYADQIEYFGSKISQRVNVMISLHPHNDRGTATAAAELGLLAGADRIEGCFFGNGERTGNVDLVNLALNLYTQGINPNLDFSDLPSTISAFTHCTNIPIHPRHPYAGELVFTAFSGSHQDAIKKGLDSQRQRESDPFASHFWDVPYLPIDPADVGLTYEAVIRVNSQSGKGGTAYIIATHLHLELPRSLLQHDFYPVIQSISDREAREMSAAEIVSAFKQRYRFGEGVENLSFKGFQISEDTASDTGSDSGYSEAFGREKLYSFEGTISLDGVTHVVQAKGDSPLLACLNAVRPCLKPKLDLRIRDSSQHLIPASSTVACFVQVATRKSRVSSQTWWGVAQNSDQTHAAVAALAGAVNNALEASRSSS